jgi:hypothetical protein
MQKTRESPAKLTEYFRGVDDVASWNVVALPLHRAEKEKGTSVDMCWCQHGYPITKLPDEHCSVGVLELHHQAAFSVAEPAHH